LEQNRVSNNIASSTLIRFAAAASYSNAASFIALAAGAAFRFATLRVALCGIHDPKVIVFKDLAERVGLENKVQRTFNNMQGQRLQITPPKAIVRTLTERKQSAVHGQFLLFSASGD
jgi:hypothetical protein